MATSSFLRSSLKLGAGGVGLVQIRRSLRQGSYLARPLLTVTGRGSLLPQSIAQANGGTGLTVDVKAQANGATSKEATPSPSGLSDYTVFRTEYADGASDWVKDLELDGAKAFRPPGQLITTPPKILVLYGSLRERSYSRLLAYEFARILELLGCDVRVFDPRGLPMKDEVSDTHPKVLEIRELSVWSEGHVWVCPEQHGTITAVFKNQIDWIPLNLGSVRPTQGRTVCIAQVNGGSQSFNVVNILRVLGRWMRMIVIPNQSSVPKAWTEFDSEGRMKESGLRDRVVDVAEEFYKFTLLTREHAGFLVDRYSERKEKREKGRLLSQAEKEAAKAKLAVSTSAQ